MYTTQVYQHRKVKPVEYLVRDILQIAAPHFRYPVHPAPCTLHPEL